MGTKEFLQGLDLDQLAMAKDLATEMLAERQKEAKRVVWVVGDNHSIIKSFSDTGYIAAAEFLLFTARENAASTQKLTARAMTLNLRPMFVIQSEYASWVDVEPSAPEVA